MIAAFSRVDQMLKTIFFANSNVLAKGLGHSRHEYQVQLLNFLILEANQSHQTR